MNNPEKLTQSECADRLGVSLRQFIRYRRKHVWLQPEGYKALVPLFSEGQVERLREEVLKHKLAVLAVLASNRRKPAPQVVSMKALRKAKASQ
jgi:hypothetical protein